MGQPMTNAWIDTQSDFGQRVETMRRRVLNDKQVQGDSRHAGGALVAEAESFRSSEGRSWQVRRALAVRARMTSRRFVIDENELLVCRPVAFAAQPSGEELAAAQRYLEHYPWPGGQAGHCELYLHDLMDKGIAGIEDDINAKMAETTGDRRETLESFLITLDGLRTVLEHAADAAHARATAAPPGRRTELETIRDACLHVSRHPPRTMHEALQLFTGVWLGCSRDDHAGCINLGHLDRWLAPFYYRDIEANRVDRDTALFLLENLYLFVNACWQDGSALAVMVSGRNEHGNDVTNELSYLCLEALRRTRMIYPTVGICWHEQTPRALLDLAVGLIAEGIVTPAFFGDDVIQEGLRNLGVPRSEACWYINSTCVEITPSGSSGIWVASPYYSLPKLLLEEIDAQAGAQAADFELFLDRYLDRVKQSIAAAVESLNSLRRKRRDHGRHPLQSVFTRDCIERARDVDDGGPRYNWVECSFVGLANMVDSLEVIRREVYATRTVSLSEMKAFLDADFAGAEVVRRRWLETYPKYGHNDKGVDQLLGRIVERLKQFCVPHRMEPDNSHCVPGAFCWVQHARLGSECGATPDGRHAGQAFADGCGAAQGRETCGPTAAVLSTTSWKHSDMIGGLAYNMKFSRRLLSTPDARAGLTSLILAYLRRGGFETQINVVDHETLLAARQDPEAYRDLVVRIGGYTDYFVRQSPEMQNEIISRAQLELQ